MFEPALQFRAPLPAIAITVICACLAPLFSAAMATETTAYLTLTSDYVRRGVSQSDGDPAIQAGGDIRFSNGFFAGAWASSIDISNGADRQRDIEVDYYAGFAFDAGDKWQFTAHTVLYTYPGQTGNVDYDYQEIAISSNYNDHFWVEYAYTPDLYNTDYSAQNIDVYVDWPLKNRWSLGLGVGRYDTSSLNDRSYAYWQIGLTRAFAWADLDIRYHDTSTWVPVISTENTADSRIAITLQIPFAF